MKKNIAWTLVVCMFVIMLSACQSNQQQQEVKRNGEPLTQIAVDMPLSPKTEAGVGVELIYESEDIIIFYGEFGLFGYNLDASEFLFSVDFVKAIGEQGAVQGSRGAVASASADGKTIILYEYDATEGVIGEACYVDISTQTFTYGEYQPLESEFQRDTVKGYIMSAIELETVQYILDNRTWYFWGDEAGTIEVKPTMPEVEYISYEEHKCPQLSVEDFNYAIETANSEIEAQFQRFVAASGIDGSVQSFITTTNQFVSVLLKTEIAVSYGSDGNVWGICYDYINEAIVPCGAYLDKMGYSYVDAYSEVGKLLNQKGFHEYVDIPCFYFNSASDPVFIVIALEHEIGADAWKKVYCYDLGSNTFVDAPWNG